MSTTYTPYYKGEPVSLPPLDMKVDKKITEGTTSVMDYIVSPYTLLSALPFGDSSFRLDDGSMFVHKDEQIESTAMVLYNNGIQCYLLSVDGQTGEVTNATSTGSWTLNQVGLSVTDIWRDGESGWVGTDHSLANVLSSLNANKLDKGWKYQGWGESITLPENYTEALVFIFGRNTHNGSRRIGAQITFLRQLWSEQVSNKIELLVAGYHVTDSDHGYGSIAITNNGRTFSIQGWQYGSGAAADTYVMGFYR